MSSPRLSGLLELLYPPSNRCAACKAKLRHTEGELLCNLCLNLLQTLPSEEPCPQCGRPGAARGCLTCLSDTVRSLDTILSAFPHAGVARDLVHALKFESVQAAALPLIEGMTEVLRPQRSGWNLLIPIPLHPRRLRERGFNQAMILAEAVGEQVGLPVRDLLIRTVYTEQQALLDAEARQRNVRDAFRSSAPMQGLWVLLIDDVRTTGATADSAAEACITAGAARVGLLTATCA